MSIPPAEPSCAAPAAPEDSVATPSRRGLLHGLAAAGAVTAGLAAAIEVHNVAAAATATPALDRRKSGRKHHKHHKHPKPTSTPTVRPTTAPTVRPTALATKTPVSVPSSVATPSVSPTTIVLPTPTRAPSASTTPTPTPSISTQATTALIADAAGRTLVSRFSYGLTPLLAAQVQQAGGPSAWFAQQMEPDSIDDAVADAMWDWWPSLSLAPLELWQRNQSATEFGWQLMWSYETWLLMRRASTQRMLLEIMTEFWENELNVPSGSDGQFTWRVDYGETIRSHALGRYDELLNAAITHPAMLIYLNGATSTKAHPNENLGRELMELHTVGQGQYTEQDVQNSARILTGWKVDVFKTWAASYSTGDHYTGPVTVMGFSDANASPDGRDVTTRYLTYLAHHPATARRIATKIAIRFCRDDPSSSLIDMLAQTYLSSGTDIRAVLSALIGSAEFQMSGGMKVRTPCDDVVATLRALDVRISVPANPTPWAHASMATLFNCMNLGQEPLNWPRPDGAPIDNDSWLSASRMIGSMGAHWNMANGYYPTTGATYRAPSSWLPASPMRLADLVDFVAQQVLVSRASPQLVNAVCLAVKYGPDEVITSTHPLVRYNFGRLLVTLLDSPTHLTR